MSELAGKAVFLSYASQDAEAARRIADSLRASGVEVWFDVEGGLEHGDEWDAKIRRQIKECVLFIPLVSANTQARHEGYFRLEWDMAAERARSIASGVAFILPVVIDATREPDALVPDRFRAVQWTKLPGGNVPPDVQARFLKLWSHRTGVLKHETVSGGPTTEDRGRGTDDGTDRSRHRKRKPAVMAFTILVLVAVAVIVIWRPWQSRNSSITAAQPALSSSNELSDARRLVEQAWAQMNRLDLARAELQVADELCRRASVLDPTDPDVWAAWSFVDAWYCYHSFENTPERREGARSKAARAQKLAPSSYEARLAQANYLVREGSDAAVSLYAPEAERLLRALLQERPKEPRTLMTFAILQRNLGHAAEARQALQTLAKDPAFAALAWHELAWVELRNGDPTTALELENRSIAIQGDWHNLTGKMNLLMNWQGDLDAAKVVLDQIPAVAMQEDYTVAVALRLLHSRRTPDALLRLADSIPRDWLQSNMYRGPLGWWRGLAEQQAGRPAAARVHWQAAMKLVERRLADAPSSPELIAWKSRLLAVLGETAEAEKTLQLARELGGVNYALERWSDESRLGQFEQALDEMESEYQTNPGSFWAAELRHSPEFDPLREQPRFIALLDRMEADPRCSPKAKVVSAPSPISQLQSPSSPPQADSKSVAVLAFANLSDDKGNEYFSDGISEELLNVLAKVPGLKVSARTSAFFFKGKQVPLAEIAQQLGVAYVVEGSVRKQGDKVRITAQLIKAADGFHLWSDTFTRDLKDAFAVQDEIAGLIAQNLRLTMGANSPGAKVAINPEAFDLYVQARQAWNLRTPEGFDRAEQLLNRALSLEPEFARAHAGLSDVWVARGMTLGETGQFGQRESLVIQRIIATAERAVALDPNSAEAHASLGSAYTSAWRLADATRTLRHAVALNPNYATGRQMLGRALLAQGFFAEGAAELARAAELDPLSHRIIDNNAIALLAMGRPTGALAAAERALALMPDSTQAAIWRARSLSSLGRHEEAVAQARRVKDDGGPQGAYFVEVFTAAGLKSEAEGLLATEERKFPAWKFIGLVALGRHDEALAAMNPADMIPQFFYQPNLDPVRDDPRFKQLLATLGLTEANARIQAWRKAHPPEKPQAKP